MRLAAVILSSRVQNLVMVAPPIEQVSRFRHVDLVRIATGTALVVVVLRSGAVRQQVIRLPIDVSQETLATSVRAGDGYGYSEDLDVDGMKLKVTIERA